MTSPIYVDARPATVNLALYAGDDFSLTVTVFDSTGQPVDLTGQTCRADIRSNTDMPVLASFTAAVATNLITLTLPGTETVLLPQTAVWDCQLSGTDTMTLLAGTVRTTAQVTV